MKIELAGEVFLSEGWPVHARVRVGLVNSELEGIGMGYSLHIERTHQAISLTEWTAAVGKVPGVKLESSDIQTQNPTTGAVISVGGNPGNAAVLFSAGGSESWKTCLFFGKRSISFAATEDIESPSNPVHIAVVALARVLGARVVGDEGEEYKW